MDGVVRRKASLCEAFLFGSHCFSAEAVFGVVVDDTGCLQPCIDDDGADEFESPLLQLFRNFGGERRLCGNRSVVLYGLAPGHLPDDGSEVFSGFLHFEKDAGTVDCGLDLGAGTDDAGVFEEAQNVVFLEAGDLCRVELFEGFAKGLTFVEDDLPGQSGLKSFEHQELPKGSTVVLRDAPLFIVVGAHKRVVFRPGATDFILWDGAHFD